MNRYLWHSWLSMPKKDLAWHLTDIENEFAELNEARGYLNRWSEKSDVVYTVSRARWSGHPIKSPISKLNTLHGYLYMYPKYTMRFLFFKRAGQKINKTSNIREVRNPKKPHKLRHIAEKYDLNPSEFEEVCTSQYRYWRFIIPK